MTRLVAVLDANVLIPENLGSFIATCAYTETFTPVLSAQILDEVARNFPSTQNRIQKMSEVFAQYFVSPSGFEISRIQLLKSPEDRHVVAAASLSKANVIVTSDVNLINEINSRADFEFTAQYPYEFLSILANEEPGPFREAVELVAHLRKRPTQWTVPKVIGSLKDIGKPWNQEFLGILIELFSAPSAVE